MTQNQPQRVTYSGFQAEERFPTGENTSSDGPEVRRAERLGFWAGKRFGERPKMAYSWFKTSLTSRRAGSRRDVTESIFAHVAM